MPRVMFTIPPAAAASRAGTDAMISALLAGVYRPRPTPSRPSSSTHTASGAGTASAAAQPAARAPPRTHRRRFGQRAGISRSAATAARPNPAGSAVSSSPADAALPPRAETTCGKSTSGPNRTR